MADDQFVSQYFFCSDEQVLKVFDRWLDWNFQVLPEVWDNSDIPDHKVFQVKKQHIQVRTKHCKPKLLAYFRLITAVTSSVYCILYVMLFGLIGQFALLFNWGILLMTFTFWALSTDHLLEGDFIQKGTFLKSAKRGKKQCCKSHWKWSVFLYEAINIFNTTVGFYFFATQIPYYIWGQHVTTPGMDQTVVSTEEKLLTIVGHAIPSLVLSLDGLISSVQFYTRHLCIMMLVATIAISVHFVIYFIHSEHDNFQDDSWFASPWVTTIIWLSIFVYLPLAWMVMVWLTRNKIRRRYKCMRKAE